MAKFKSIPGAMVKGVGKFDAQGFLETSCPKAIENLKKNKLVEEIKSEKKEKQDLKDQDEPKGKEDLKGKVQGNGKV